MNFRKITDIMDNSLASKWSKIVGNVLAQHTSPKWIKDDILTLYVISPCWSHHVNALRHDIIKNVKKEMNISLQRIKIFNRAIGRVYSPIAFYNEEISLDIDYEDVGEIFKEIKDCDLKSKLIRIGGLALSRKKNLGGHFV